MREYRSDDLQPVGALEAQIPSSWRPHAIEQAQAQKGTIALVALVSEQTIGGWLCGRYASDEAELFKVTVDASLRRKGIAQLLIADFCQRLVRTGVKALYLEVRSHNLPARRLYEKLGFCGIGQRSGYYRNPDDDACLLMRELLP